MLNNMPQQDDRLSIFKLIDIFFCAYFIGKITIIVLHISFQYII